MVWCVVRVCGVLRKKPKGLIVVFGIITAGH